MELLHRLFVLDGHLSARQLKLILLNYFKMCSWINPRLTLSYQILNICYPNSKK